MTQQIPSNSGQTHATSHLSMMLNYQNPSTVQYGRNATTHISSLHLEASRTCVRSQSLAISRTHNTSRSVLVPTHSWYRKLYLSDDVLTLWKQTGMDTQQNLISLLKTLNRFQPTTSFCRQCTCSIQKTHTKRMSNRIRSRSN